jgi:F1F0 ATPase subunit 2
MNDWNQYPLIEFGLSLGAGGLLGILYFGGLWWTVTKFQSAKVQSTNGAVGLYLASVVIRTSVLLLCLFLLMQLGMVPLCLAIAGFFLARTVMIRHFRSSQQLGLPQKTIG